MFETVLTKLQPTVKRPPTIPSETGYAISTVYSKNKVDIAVSNPAPTIVYM